MSTQPAALSQRNLWLTLAAVVWLVLMAIVWWLGHQLSPTWFDPARVAPHGFTEPANTRRLLMALWELKPDLPRNQALFIRFAQPDCACERFVESYHQLMEPTLRKQGLYPVTLLPEDMERLASGLGPQLWEWIPSTPAILVTTQDHQIAYFGPYHQEGICNSENSYLEPVLQSLQADQPVSIVNTLVEGCFCSYPQAAHLQQALEN